MASAHQSSGSSSFLPSLSGAGGRNVTQHSIAAIRAKEKNLVSTLQCHPQQDRQNITKNQYSRKLSSNVFCLVWLLSPSVVNRFFFFRYVCILNCVTCFSPLLNSLTS